MGSGKKLDKAILLKVSEGERDALRRRAEAAGLPVSGLIRRELGLDRVVRGRRAELEVAGGEVGSVGKSVLEVRVRQLEARGLTRMAAYRVAVSERDG